jgi:hypothetical protein
MNTENKGTKDGDKTHSGVTPHSPLLEETMSLSGEQAFKRLKHKVLHHNGVDISPQKDPASFHQQI